MPLMPAPDRTWDPNHIPFQAIAEAESKPDKPVEYFQAPPEPDKTDIQLLRDLDTRRLAELMEVSTTMCTFYHPYHICQIKRK